MVYSCFMHYVTNFHGLFLDVYLVLPSLCSLIRLAKLLM